ncbi:Heat shock protein 60 family chaperone GroEL OR Thermosome subunit [Candidatus Nitrosotalea sp. FS]|uniref:thermosome subunit beta n=1 Tax=Candidatus Nitrosotalea sp. FS TaxID=2341021 RepID=UPI001409B58B|nr:thermosome subunit beta [Candidatus Nitrosotalea sp. FS]NHH97414.1 Heat shock protein 60 family chaperone GroEL OR Thermosome subunit [Candidatus Nitrosotalea sp. FS]
MTLPTQQTPIILLKEGSTQTKGNDAQRNNIQAAKLVSELVRTSLGPRGMDKMLVDTLGDVTITNDGATILKEIDVQHPAAKMMVEISKSTDNEVGDGTTSTVVLAGALLEKAEELVTKNVHPTVVVDGFKKASEKAIEVLRQVATLIDPRDKKYLKKIATTTLASKLVSTNSSELADVVVDSVLAVAEKLGDKYKVDIDNIKVEKKSGGSIRDTKLIQGIVLDKEVVHGAMPKRIENAKIALLNAPLEIEKTEFDAKININSPDQMQLFIDEENKMIKKMTDKITQSGANVVLCQKGIDDMAQHYLQKAGILAVRRIKESDMTKLAKATGARIVSNVTELTANDLGAANLVEERFVETDRWVFVEDCKNPKAVSILVRGGSQRIVDEAERSVHDALMAVKDAVVYPKIVVGGGAPEAHVAHKIREWANTLEGRSQLAAQKFADGIETIPLVLAENTGMDPLDTQVDLRSKSASGKATYGIDVITAKVGDLSTRDIYEPLAVKEQVINAATETACMILRIDDVIAASKSREMPKPGGYGGPGGDMSGMDM